MTGEQQNPEIESPPEFGEILINPHAEPSDNEEKEPVSPPEPKKTQPGKPRRQRKKNKEETGGSRKNGSKKRILLCSLLLLLLPTALFLSYLAAATYLLPYYIREQLTEQYSRRFNRPVTVTQVDFAPFTFDLHLAGIHIGPEFDRKEENEPALCRIAEIDAQFRPEELLQRKVVLENMRIKGMQVEAVRRADGSFTDPGLSQLSRKGGAGMVDQVLLPNWLRIDGFSLTDSMLVIRDATNGKEYHLDEITFSLPSAAAKQGATEPVLHAVVNGNPVQIQGQRQVGPDGSSATRLVLRLDNVDPQQLLDWLPGKRDSLRISTDRTEAVLELILPDKKSDNIGPSLSGTINFTGLQLDALSTGDDAARSGRLQCTAPNAHLVIRANPFRQQYTVEELILDQPRLIFTDSTGKTPRDQLPPERLPILDTVQDFLDFLDPASLSFDLIIQRLRINQGTVKDSRDSLWKELQLELTAYRNKATAPAGEEQQDSTALVFSARQGDTTVQFQGTAAPDLSLIGKISLDKLDSSALQPYLQPYLKANKAVQVSGGKTRLVMEVNPLLKQYKVDELTMDQPRFVLADSKDRSGTKSSTNRLPLSFRPGQMFDPASLPFDLMIHRFTINKGTVHKEKKTLWENLQLELTAYRNRGNEQAEKATALSFSARQGDTTVQFQGTAAHDLSLIGKITLNNLDSSALQPYLQENLNANKAVQVSGGKTRLVMQVNPLLKQYKVDELTMDQPRFVLADSKDRSGTKSSTNRLPLSFRPGQMFDPASLPFDLMIHHLTINKGAVHKEQENGPLWEELHLELTDYQNRETPSSVKGQAKKVTALSFSARQGKTTVQFQGAAAPDLSLTGKISLNNLNPSLLQPYLNAREDLLLAGGQTEVSGLLRTVQAKEGGKKKILIDKGTITLRDISLKRKEQGKDEALLTAQTAESKGCSIDLDPASPSLSCADLLLSKAEFSSEAPSFFLFPEKAESLIGLSVDTVRITDSTAGLRLGGSQNGRSGLTIPLTGLNLDVSDLHGVSSEKDNLHVQAKVGIDGTLTADGSFRQGKGKLKLAGKDLDITLLNPAFVQLFQKEFAPSLQHGRLSLQGLFRVPEFDFQGDVQLQDLLAENSQGAALGWKSGRGGGVSAGMYPFFVHIDEFIVQEPELKLHSPASGLPGSLISLLRRQDNKPVLPPFTVRQCRIQEGSMPGTGSRLGFTAVNGTLAGLAAGAPSTFIFSGKANERDFSSQGRLNRDSAEVDSFTVAELPMENAAEQFSDQLKLEKKGGIRWIPSAEQKDAGSVHFSGFTPRPDSEYALLLALLTDSDGSFSLPLSLPATASPAQVSEAALKKLHRLHLQAVVSPQAILEKDLSDLTLPQRVDFIVGDRLPDFMDDLENFVPLFARRPYLGLRVRGCYDDTADRKYLLRMLQEEEDYRVDLENVRRREEMARLIAEEELRQVELVNTDMPIGEDRIPAIEAREDLQPLPRKPVVLPKEILPELARQRSLVVRKYLVETLNLPAEKITLAEPTSGGPRVDLLIEPIWPQHAETKQTIPDQAKE